MFNRLFFWQSEQLGELGIMQWLMQFCWISVQTEKRRVSHIREFSFPLPIRQAFCHVAGKVNVEVQAADLWCNDNVVGTVLLKMLHYKATVRRCSCAIY